MSLLGDAARAPLEVIISDLKRQLERERARLDWWASHSLDTCVRHLEPGRPIETIQALDQDNIRASIDSGRRRELVARSGR